MYKMSQAFSLGYSWLWMELYFCTLQYCREMNKHLRDERDMSNFPVSSCLFLWPPLTDREWFYLCWNYLENKEYSVYGKILWIEQVHLKNKTLKSFFLIFITFQKPSKYETSTSGKQNVVQADGPHMETKLYSGRYTSGNVPYHVIH